ncbi:glycosyl transferase family 8 domain-containing protein [Sarocladium implicatum]|nr:glycosyl transferase family 8 domain-containing protein [Sarocladium implicatum]
MWPFSKNDYGLLPMGMEAKSQKFFSSKSAKLLLATACLLVLLAVGAFFNPGAVSSTDAAPPASATAPATPPANDNKAVLGKEGAHPPKPVGYDNKNEVDRPDYLPATNVKEKDKFAYLIWLSSAPEEDTENFDINNYFVASRVLIWQLLHDPKAKASPDIDVVVMTGPQVNEAHRERLRKDGAIVKEVDIPHGNNDTWIVPEESRWADVMGKLRAWELTEYSRVLMLDGDILLQSSLDGIFHESGAKLMQTKPEIGRKDDEPELPEDYVLCTFMELQSANHDWPPTDRGRFPGYFNAGFFMLKPDKKMFDYYMSLLDIPHRFSPEFPEQNLLNYAHRWDGAMPWKEIPAKWNTKFTSEKDLEGGVVSMHEKFWKLRSGGKGLIRFVESKRWQAEGYWLAQRDAEKAAKQKEADKDAKKKESGKKEQ